MNGAAPWVEGHTFPSALAETVSKFGERDAVVFPTLGVRWSYREFAERSGQLARSLVAMGLPAGGHVGIWATNRPEWILAQFGVAAAGGVLVNVNPAYRTGELGYVLAQADIQILLVTDRFKSSDYESMIAELVPELAGAPFGDPISSARFPRLRHVVSIKNSSANPGIWPWEAFLERAAVAPAKALAEREGSIGPSSPVNIQYTSGTTGSPKGAMLTHRNLLFNAFHVGARMRFTERDRLAIPVPFYHCFGCVMGTLLCSLYGAAMVVPAESFDPETTLDAVEKERCTALYGVPTMFNAELHAPSFPGRDLSSLRTGIMAGSPCPIELMRQVAGRMHLPEMTIAYGLTEASPVITQTETTEPLEIRVTTVGRPLPGLEVKLVDPASGRAIEGEGQGELCVRGHGVMLGYYNKPEETRAAIEPDGFLHTGDLATRTATGHYKITGRIKDMIIRGGENIYPRELEEFLLTHPKIKDVQVVGLPSARFGEEVSAWIVPIAPGALTVEEVLRFCREKIAHYKLPRYVVFVEEYPLTVSGKVQKFRLREMGIARFGLGAAANTETA